MQADAPTLPFDAEPTRRRAKKRGHVRATSIAQYRDGRERFTGRKAHTLQWLAGFTNRWGYAPTSGELSRWALDHNTFDFIVNMHDSERLLYVRRGLSDLQSDGVVEAVKDGKRKCFYQGVTCETWRVIPVGRS